VYFPSLYPVHEQVTLYSQHYVLVVGEMIEVTVGICETFNPLYLIYSCFF